VRIRRRKPCVLARRRLLGWNVRLLTRGLPDWWRSCLAPRGARVGGGSRSAARKAPATPQERGGEHKAGTAQQPSTTRPGHGTGGRRPGSNRSGPTGRHRRPVIVAGQRPRTGATRPGAVRSGAGRGEKCRCGLWTTACWGCDGLVSVSRVAGRVPGRTTSTHPIAVATVLAAAAQDRVGQNRTDRGNLCTQAVDDRVDGDRGAPPGPGSCAPRAPWEGPPRDRRDHRSPWRLPAARGR
jgi:hypothetical protein